MAAITTSTAHDGVAPYALLENKSAQATTGQTDWLNRPSYAKFMIVHFNLTAVAGTTPTSTLSLLTVPPNHRTVDTYAMNLAEHAAITGATAARLLVVQVGPGITGIADDTTASATVNSQVSINAILPPLIGIKILNDRADGDETYTYTLTVEFRGDR